MSLRGGFSAGLLVAGIVCFCFSINLSGSSSRDATEPTRVDDVQPDGRWHVEVRLACQPSARPDPTLHRARPQEAENAQRPLMPRTQLAAR